MFLHDATAFRLAVKPSITKDHDQRALARDGANIVWAEVQQIDDVEADEDMRDRLVLNRTQFKAHVEFWEKLDSKAAVTKFDMIFAVASRETQ